MQTIKSFLLNSRILLVLLVLVLFAGCSDDEGSTGEPGTIDRLFSYKEITSCSRCHDGTNGDANLSKANFHNALVNKDGSNVNWASFTGGIASVGNNPCIKNYNLVDPPVPGSSAVLYTISTEYGSSSSCDNTVGYHAPQNATLSREAFKDFILWIENGAKP